MNTIGEALRLVRVYHDIKQTQLSYDLSISSSYLSEIESGKKPPTLELLKKYSDKFNIPVSSVLFFSENIEQAKLTDKVRIIVANKIILLLKWVNTIHG